MVKKNNKKFLEKLKKHKKKIILITTILIIALILAFGALSYAKKGEKITIKKEPEFKAEILNSSLTQQIPTDIVLGDINAPVTIVEYASLSCPHCAHFYNDVFDKIKSEYIDKGTVKFIFRDFPLNQSALLGSVIALCIAKDKNNDPKEYYKIIKAMFKTQDSWAFDEKFFDKLRSIMKLDNISEQKFEACSKDQSIVQQVLNSRINAIKELKIESTPTFYINGFVIGGGRPFEDFKKIIDKSLENKILNRNNQNNVQN